MNAILSTLEFVLRNCIMYGTNDAVLNKELVDLGLPRGTTHLTQKTLKAYPRPTNSLAISCSTNSPTSF